MPTQDTLPLNLTPTLVRVTRIEKGRRYSVSGALPKAIAEKRMSRLMRTVPDGQYELVDVNPATTDTRPWRLA